MTVGMGKWLWRLSMTMMMFGTTMQLKCPVWFCVVFMLVGLLASAWEYVKESNK